MRGVLSGVRVIELASWGFVPSTGAILADWGAEVIKVEPPEGGDPMRGLATAGLTPSGASPINFMFEWPNRGKRSVAIDVRTEAGHELLMRLVETADVLITSYLPDVRQRLRVDLEDVRARNPQIIYARGSGQGPEGPDAGRPGFDAVAFWSRGGIGMAYTAPGSEWPLAQRTPAFGDVYGGLAIAGGVAAALAGRALHGETSVVDVSLLGTAAWALSPLLAAAALYGINELPSGDRRHTPNPLVGVYATSDRRFITLTLLQPDRWWDGLCARLGRPELAVDPRFLDGTARRENAGACVDALDEAFGGRTLAQWQEAFEGFDAPWSAMQTLGEILVDPQVQANHYMIPIAHDESSFSVVPAPAQFDQDPPDLRRAPELGADTDAILLELGLDMEQVIEHKVSGAVL